MNMYLFEVAIIAFQVRHNTRAMVAGVPVERLRPEQIEMKRQEIEAQKQAVLERIRSVPLAIYGVTR